MSARVLINETMEKTDNSGIAAFIYLSSAKIIASTYSLPHILAAELTVPFTHGVRVA